MILPNCEFCGRFVGYKKPYVAWVPYGNSLALEPPDDEYAHRECWDKHQSEQGLVKAISWLGPTLYESASAGA